MRKFLLKTFFFLLPIPVIIICGLLLPTTPRASKSLLMASINKKALLKTTSPPRIIFIGGSNTCFGLNSQTIYSTLGLNPINTGIHALIGIKYMIDNSVEDIKKGDIVILIPEYGHYYRDLDAGSEELMRTIFDVEFSNIQYLDIHQLSNIFSFLPKYALSKYRLSEYKNIQESEVYSVNSFNKYGDTYTHWNKKPEKVTPFPTISGDFNYEVIKYFEKYNEEISKKGAVLLVSFPCYQASSFKNSINQIKKVENELNHSKLTIIGSAERYMMPDSLIFNTPYHLTKSGVDYRTSLLIEDLARRAKSH